VVRSSTQGKSDVGQLKICPADLAAMKPPRASRTPYGPFLRLIMIASPTKAVQPIKTVLQNYIGDRCD
jgi:hypothetical protein